MDLFWPTCASLYAVGQYIIPSPGLFLLIPCWSTPVVSFFLISNITQHVLVPPTCPPPLFFISLTSSIWSSFASLPVSLCPCHIILHPTKLFLCFSHFFKDHFSFVCVKVVTPLAGHLCLPLPKLFLRTSSASNHQY